MMKRPVSNAGGKLNLPEAKLSFFVTGPVRPPHAEAATGGTLVTEDDARRVAEARLQLARYLSDEIAPMIFADAAEDLFRAPPELVAHDIRGWIGIQLQGANPSEICDYLFHSAKKVYHLGELELLPREELEGYLAQLTPILLGLCPERDRAELAANLGRLDVSSDVVAAQISVGKSPSARGTGDGGGGVGGPSEASGQHRRTIDDLGAVPDVPRQAGSADSPTGVGQDGSNAQGGGAAAQIDRLNLLLDRWERFSPPIGQSSTSTPPSPGATLAGAQNALVSRIIDEVASTASNSTELDNQLRMLSDFGLGSVNQGVLRALSNALPDWAPALPTGDDQPRPLTGAAETMRKVVDLSKDAGELRSRFGELISAAIEEFNRGSLGRAVTVFDLAERMIAEQEVDVSIAANIIDQCSEQLDESQLRKYIEDEDKHLLLRRVMNIYPPLHLEQLFRDLIQEERRDRRRLIIRLLEIYGEEAHSRTLQLLDDSLSGNVPQPWFVQRNLIYLMRSIPAGEGHKIDKEIDLLIRASVPGGELPLTREALTSLGQIDHPRSVQTLAARISEFEDLLGEKDAVHQPPEIQSLLDTAVKALIRSGTKDARQCVVTHGLKKRPEIGNTLGRMAGLGGQDLSDDPTTVTRITEAIKEEFPMKVFGVKVKSSRRTKNLEQLIASLAGTDTPHVRKTLDGIVRQFPGEQFANAAAKTLSNLGKVKPTDQPLENGKTVTSLSGDLALFGLPNLMQNLADSRVEGVLTVLDETSNATVTIRLRDGTMVAATFGDLDDETAVYQVLERPTTGRFIFVNQPSDASEKPDPGTGPSVMSLLMEGMRRYDEFNRAAAIIPDDGRFEATGEQPSGLPDEDDADFVNGIWVKATQGTAPSEIEKGLNVDSYRIFRLFEHWVNEGSLKPR